MGARWYAPSAGDFTSADTVQVSPDPDPVAGNPFAYAGDEPLDVTDPSGHGCGIFSVVCSAGKSLYHKVASSPVVKAVVKKIAPVVKAVVKKAAPLVRAVVRVVRDIPAKVADGARAVVHVAVYAVTHPVAAVKAVVRAVKAMPVVKKAVSALKTAGKVLKAAGAAVKSAAVSAGRFVKAHAASAARSGIGQAMLTAGALANPLLAPAAAWADAPVVKAHWRGMVQAGEVAAAVGLTVANVLQLGADPVTDGLEAADIGALAEAGTEEAASAAAETGVGEAASAGAETGAGEAPAEGEPATGENDGEDSGTCPAEGGQSFTAGTLVLLAFGKTVPISQLKAGARSSPPTPRPARTSPRRSPPSWSTVTPTSTTSPSKPRAAPRSSTPPATTCSGTLIRTTAGFRQITSNQAYTSRPRTASRPWWLADQSQPCMTGGCGT
jgi:hypothetical protein